jgi:hypothetical protein
MSTTQPDPYAVLGLNPDAKPAEITTAYRRAVRTCHPDAPRPDPERLAAVIAAYRQLRRDRDPDSARRAAGHAEHSPHGHDIPVRVHHTTPQPPDVRAGPVRHQPPRS